MLRALESAAGLGLVALVLSDVFRSVVVPGATHRALRLGPLLGAVLLPLWRRLARPIRSARHRRGLLGGLAPLLIVLELVLWVAGLTLGYGLVLHALGAALDPRPDLSEALFQAGSSVLTLGLTNIRAHEGLAQLVVLLAGLSGLAVITLVVTFVLSVQGALQRRKTPVVMLASRGGRPPAGLVVLETYARLGLTRADQAALLARWEEWCAEVTHTHQAYPVLAFFRSTDGDNDWLSSLGAVLDAASLTVAASAAEDAPRGTAALLLATGGRLVADLCGLFRLRPPPGPLAREEEFATARRRLTAAGWPLRDGGGDSWREFAELRAGYAGGVAALAAHFGVPAMAWPGPAASPDRPACDDRRSDYGTGHG